MGEPDKIEGLIVQRLADDLFSLLDRPAARRCATLPPSHGSLCTTPGSQKVPEDPRITIKLIKLIKSNFRNLLAPATKYDYLLLR